MDKESKYLFRALRPEEIEAGNILIPKSQGPFLADPRLEIDTRSPFVLGPTEEHAVRQHQWTQNGFPTSGISTTPHIRRAEYYAQKHKVIVKIDRSILQRYDIREYIVREWLGFPVDVAVPDDDEVILVRETEGTWPKEIIVEIIYIE